MSRTAHEVTCEPPALTLPSPPPNGLVPTERRSNQSGLIPQPVYKRHPNILAAHSARQPRPHTASNNPFSNASGSFPPPNWPVLPLSNISHHPQRPSPRRFRPRRTSRFHICPCLIRPPVNSDLASNIPLSSPDLPILLIGM